MHGLFGLFDENGNGGVDLMEANSVARLLSFRQDRDALYDGLTSAPSPNLNVIEQVRLELERARATEAANRQANARARRSQWATYSLTVAAMFVSVISFGHLMANHPRKHFPWREVRDVPAAKRGVMYSVVFIGMLSGFDLLWTTAHAQNLHFQEVNPVGSRILADGISPLTFKLATLLVSLLLFVRLRRFRGVQVASWWMCFVCTLVTFRWLLLKSTFLE
jgi:hypothetical protein